MPAADGPANVVYHNGSGRFARTRLEKAAPQLSLDLGLEPNRARDANFFYSDAWRRYRIGIDPDVVSPHLWVQESRDISFEYALFSSHSGPWYVGMA